MVICDTDVFIEYLKGDSKTKKKLVQIGVKNIGLSVISVMELYYGAINKNELNKIKKAIASLNILNVNDKISIKSMKLIESFSKSHGLKIPDALIAATTIIENTDLFTYNKKDYKFIREIKFHI